MPRKANGFRGKGKTIIRVFCEGETEQGYTEFLKSSFTQASLARHSEIPD